MLEIIIIRSAHFGRSHIQMLKHKIVKQIR